MIAGVCVFQNSASIHCGDSELWRDTRDCDQTVSGCVFNRLKPVTVFCDHAQCVHLKIEYIENTDYDTVYNNNIGVRNILININLTNTQEILIYQSESLEESSKKNDYSFQTSSLTSPPPFPHLRLPHHQQIPQYHHHPLHLLVNFLVHLRLPHL